MCRLEVHFRDDERHDVRRRKLIDARMQNMLIVNSELRFVLKSRAASGTAVDERRSIYLKRGGAHCAGGT